MKLATLKNSTRDGILVVVNKRLTRAIPVPHIAPTLQAALDDWSNCIDKLVAVYNDLNQNDFLSNSIAFSESDALSPLPRAYQWLDGSAYVNHIELVRKARGAEMPDDFWHNPLMYQGGSDSFLAPHSAIPVLDESWGVDFESEIAVITDDVPMGITKNLAEKHICLVMLVNDVSLRNLIPAELAKSFGFLQSKPSSSFSPVAVTLDELGDDWHEHKVNLPLLTYYNNKLFGRPHAGTDMTFDFADLIVHAAKTRNLSAGSIIGSGTVSNYDRSLGSSCIAERRMLEVMTHGKPITQFMTNSDSVRIELLDRDNESIFGSIEQTIVTTKSKASVC